MSQDVASRISNDLLQLAVSERDLATREDQPTSQSAQGIACPCLLKRRYQATIGPNSRPDLSIGCHGADGPRDARTRVFEPVGGAFSDFVVFSVYAINEAVGIWSTTVWRFSMRARSMEK